MTLSGLSQLSAWSEFRLRMMPGRSVLQNAAMRARGLGWEAEPCPDPRSCELYLCVVDDTRRHWHPVDPLAFAKWRVRSRLEAIPPHVIVRTETPGEIRIGRIAVGRGLLVGVLGIAAAAVAMLLWQAGHGGRGHSRTV